MSETDAEWLADPRARTIIGNGWCPGAVGSVDYIRLVEMAERALEAETEVELLTQERDILQAKVRAVARAMEGQR